MRGHVCICREAIGSVRIQKTGVVWDGTVQTPRSQLGENLMKLQPFTALLHGEAASVASLRFCCKETGVSQAAGWTRKNQGLLWAKTSTKTQLAKDWLCWRRWVGFKLPVQAADQSAFKPIHITVCFFFDLANSIRVDQ